MYFSPPFLTPLLPQSIPPLPYPHQSGGGGEQLKESAAPHLQRFRASFSFLTSEILDGSSLGESKTKGQMKVKKQIEKTGNRGSGKTCVKRDQEREEEIWRGSRRQPPPAPPPTGHPSFSHPAHSKQPHQRVRVWDPLCGDGDLPKVDRNY